MNSAKIPVLFGRFHGYDDEQDTIAHNRCESDDIMDEKDKSHSIEIRFSIMGTFQPKIVRCLLSEICTKLRQFSEMGGVWR